jgi:hypothetical protein
VELFANCFSSGANAGWLSPHGGGRFTTAILKNDSRQSRFHFNRARLIPNQCGFPKRVSQVSGSDRLAITEPKISYSAVAP